MAHRFDSLTNANGQLRAAAAARGAAARSANDLEAELSAARDDWALTVDLPPAERNQSWGWILRVMSRIAAGAVEPERTEAYLALATEADTAYLEMSVRWSGTLRPNTLRTQLDFFAEYMRIAAEALGQTHPPPAADLARRQRARPHAGPLELTFFQKHRDGIVAVWRRDGREWWRLHYIDVHGTEPPDGWWIDNDNPRAVPGGQIAPGMMREFDYLDRGVTQAFFDEMEALYRREAGLPARGEGWVSQTHLARCVEEALPGYEVLREASPDWLAPQRLDVYVPALRLAIEYQGVQHYEAVALFGGEDALADRKLSDERKRLACRAAGVRLIEWRYDEPVSVESVRHRIGHG